MCPPTASVEPGKLYNLTEKDVNLICVLLALRMTELQQANDYPDIIENYRKVYRKFRRDDV
jgi:hypothetical protein